MTCQAIEFRLDHQNSILSFCRIVTCLVGVRVFSEQLSVCTDKSSTEAVTAKKKKKIPHGETDPTRRRTLKQSPPGFRRAKNSGKGVIFINTESICVCVVNE